MEKITSFTIDHIKLTPGTLRFQKRSCRRYPGLITFDIRITNPNEEPVLNTAEVHTIEHLACYLSSQPCRIWPKNTLFRTNGMPHRILSASYR